MERVTFLIESSQTRIGCLMNPESLTIRRASGVGSRRRLQGAIGGAGLSDDPLHFAGGGITEIDLRLLFDVAVAGSSIETRDVRELTGPLWRLCENAGAGGRFGRPPTVRMLWGKGWNIPAIVIAAAERFEAFSNDGLPRRSWLQLRLRRTSEPPLPPPPPIDLDRFPERPDVLEPPPEAVAGMEAPIRRVTVQEDERIDQFAARVVGDASLWPFLAAFADIDDVLRLDPGAEIPVPDLDAPIPGRTEGAP